jgi:hypothetical protein
MNTSRTTALLAATFFSLALAGCNSKPAPAVEATAGGATASIASADSQETQSPTAASAPDAPAAASIGASAVEARAGDVSVKLPN